MLVAVQGSNPIRLVQSPGFTQVRFTKDLDMKSGRLLQICLYSFIVLAIADVDVLAATVGIYYRHAFPSLLSANKTNQRGTRGL
jgi:hypothetical protein